MHLHHEYVDYDAPREHRLYTAPRTWVAGELVTAAIMNTHVRDNFKAVGEWEPGDMKMTYVTDANATTTTLTEPQIGWYISNGATFVQASHPTLYANIGSTTTLPDYRGRMFVAPGTQDGHSFTRGETGGEYDHALSTGELASHTHPDNFSVSGTFVTAVNVTNDVQFVEGAVNFVKSLTAPTGSPSLTGSVQSAGSGTAHATMSPYRVGGMVLVKNDN